MGRAAKAQKCIINTVMGFFCVAVVITSIGAVVASSHHPAHGPSRYATRHARHARHHHHRHHGTGA